METNTHTITATSTALPSIKGEPVTNPNDFTFVVKYAEGFTGRKPWAEGTELIVSKEVAEDFKKRGLGSIKGEAESNEVVEEVKANEPQPEPQPEPEPEPQPEPVTTVTEAPVEEPSKEVAEDFKKPKTKK